MFNITCTTLDGTIITPVGSFRSGGGSITTDCPPQPVLGDSRQLWFDFKPVRLSAQAVNALREDQHKIQEWRSRQGNINGK